MGLLDKHKKFNSVDWEVNTDGWEYKKASECSLETNIPIHGCFITADKGYGLGAVVIADGYLINLPNRYVDTIHDILVDEESIADIKSGNFGIKITTFTSKQYKRTGYSVEFVKIK